MKQDQHMPHFYMMTNTRTDSEHSTATLAGDLFIFIELLCAESSEHKEPISFLRGTVANMTADTFPGYQLARFLMGLNEEAGLL